MSARIRVQEVKTGRLGWALGTAGRAAFCLVQWDGEKMAVAESWGSLREVTE